jgi:peptidoglycan hydrolase CwlO-like protein
MKLLKSFKMEEVAMNFLWIVIGATGSLIVGILSFIIRNSISKNATKETVSAKTDLLEKDIEHLTKELEGAESKFSILHKRISDLRDSAKEIYVSKELFHQTIQQLNEKLDTILKFVEK